MTSSRFPTLDIYNGVSPAEIGRYTYAEASRYLKIPPTTVRYWAKGGSVTTPFRRIHFEPVLSGRDERGLSFLDLTELFIVRALRETFRLSLPKIRRAQAYAAESLGIERLFLREIRVHGSDIFLEHFGSLVATTRHGQVALREILERYLQRIDFDEHAVPSTLYPIIETSTHPRPVQIAPTIGFGAPTVYNTGIRTRTVIDRIDSGETLKGIAADFGLDLALVEDVILFHAAA